MNDSIEDQIKNSMDELTDAIDVDTQVKLNEARYQALNQKKKAFNLQWFKPLVGTGVLVLLMMAALPFMTTKNVEQEPGVFLVEDVEFLAEDTGVEFYQDLEFLAWLDDNQLLESEI